MWRGVFRIGTAPILVALAAHLAAAPQAVAPTAASPAASKPFIECDAAELVRAVPELAGIQFDPNQDRLDELLEATGDTLSDMFARPVAVAAAEEIHEIRIEDSMTVASRRESFRYVVRLVAGGAQEHIDEVRMDANTGSTVHTAQQIDFLVLGHFLELLNDLLPQNRERLRLRYIGRWNGGGKDAAVVAFAQRAEGTSTQGILWIDAATNRVLRLRTDLLGRAEGFPLETLTTDVSLVTVNFKYIGGALWLPAIVTVHARYAGGELHSVHRYSDYRLYGVDGESDPAQKEKLAGVPSITTPNPDDAYELLARGVSLALENKSGEAIAALREALRLNPDMPAAHYNLANALRLIGDLAGAEGELRAAMKSVPDSGPVHNFLGLVLFKRGDTAGAVAEFRKSAELQPKDAIVHFNLAQALEKLGDGKAALEEYRTASTLAPGNPDFKARYERLVRSIVPGAPESAATIRVEVRQVLVPVIVTNKEGHHVTGLAQSDFRVFEDGVEQKISGFSVEDAGVSAPGSAAASAAAPATEPESALAPVAPKPKPAAVRRTYLICIDTLHSAFANLVHIREALAKLFRTEPAGDSQYMVIAVGTSTEIVQGPTTDPEAVLKAVESKNFQRLFLVSRRGSTEDDLRQFRRALEDVRAACDDPERRPECLSGRRRLPSEASQIADKDEMFTAGFLSQLRSRVQELAHLTGRRTIILFSDGFQLVPGKEAWELLEAYFPDIPFVSLRKVARMQDLEPVLRMAANNNIPVYTIDSRGLYTSAFFDASNSVGSPRVMPAVLQAMNEIASDAGQTLSEIAAATGGTAFQNSNDILNGLQRAVADGRQYYMLAYTPSNSHSDGKFRAISVRVRDSKMVVNAKRGYWATEN
ncbi:MAG: VWA domain-containing protein [Bryobacteraceae bacterium]